MTLLQSILLGIIQGLTEFLPISSSAHLVIFPYLLKWQIPSNEAFVFDVLVQVASTIAVILFFWKDLVSIFQAFLSNIVNKRPLRDPNSSLGWYLIIATIPAGVLGVALKGFVERAFATPVTAAVFLLFTALLLLIAERVGKQSRAIDTLSWKDSLWIGMAQALAIFPGISRSGATIAGGMTRNLERPSATRFAMLLSIPIMLAAGLLASFDLLQIPNLSNQLAIYFPGFLVSLITSYLSIRWLLRYVAHHPLYVFSIYCAALASFVLGIQFVVL